MQTIKDQESYNGWTNFDTWNAHLWLTNDEFVCNHALFLAKRDNKERLKSLFRKMFYDQARHRYIDNIKVRQVNWNEIIESLKE